MRFLSRKKRGDLDDVPNVLRKEMELRSRFGLKYRFNKMNVRPIAGEALDGDCSRIERLGIRVDKSQSIMFMKVPVMGSETFPNSSRKSKPDELDRIFENLGKLLIPHVAYYLLKQAGGVVLYNLRGRCHRGGVGISIL